MSGQRLDFPQARGVEVTGYRKPSSMAFPIPAAVCGEVGRAEDSQFLVRPPRVLECEWVGWAWEPEWRVCLPLPPTMWTPEIWLRNHMRGQGGATPYPVC